jgi:ketosteroid isomerase-like protein
VRIVEVNMNSSATEFDKSKIATSREAWLAAVKASDAESLAQMLTDDVVVVHGKRAVRVW